MKRIVVLCLLVFCLAPLAAWSEDAQPISSHREAAQELLRIMNAEKNAADGAHAFIDVMIQQNAQMEDFRDVLLKWVKTTLSWDQMGPRMTDLYMRTFTEAEIRELIVFYKTPVGQKTLQQMPILMQEGMQIGADLAKEHQAELEQAIRARQKELYEKPEPGVEDLEEGEEEGEEEEEDADEPPSLNV